MELASNGDNRAVDQYSNELYSETGSCLNDDSVYSLLKAAKPGLEFCFGKAAETMTQTTKGRRSDAILVLF